MDNFFQNAQNHGFWNFDFWFLSREKGNYKLLFIWMKAHPNEKISLSYNQCYALQVNLFVTLRQIDSSV